MKKIWKMKKSKEAVSPVIATILMVAITVVLAAVLYVMVMGFGSNPDSNPTMSLSKSPSGAANEEKVLIADVSDPISNSSLKISLVINGAAYTLTGGAGAWTGSLPTGVTVKVVSLDPLDGKMSAGDYVLVKNTNVGQTMVFSFLYGSEQKSIGSTDWTSF